MRVKSGNLQCRKSRSNHNARLTWESADDGRRAGPDVPLAAGPSGTEVDGGPSLRSHRVGQTSGDAYVDVCLALLNAVSTALNFDSFGLLVVFVLPGLVSMQVYRLLMPAKDVPWSDAVLQAFFYSAVNFALLFPAAYALLSSGGIGVWSGWGIAVGFVFVGPILWPFLLVKLYRSDWFTRRVRVPYPSTWDYFFDNQGELFLLVHLNSGKVMGGLWSTESYAGHYPDDGDLYLEAVYAVNEDGTFGERVTLTGGLLIRRDQYTHIEIFKPQEVAEPADGVGELPAPTPADHGEG